jgi:ABC-type bacteriocin/lantibiotic exporter with double-glycine peptidase domain
MNINIIKSFYNLFIKDTVRIYKIIPKIYKIKLLFVFFLQILTAIFESLSIFILALFGVSIGAPHMVRNQFYIKKIFYYFPNLELYCADQKNLVICTAILVVIFILLKNSINLKTFIANFTISENLSAFIGKEVFNRFLNSSYYWHLSPKSQDVFSKLFFRKNFSVFFNSILNFYSYAISVFIIMIALCIAELKLTIIIFSTFGIVSLLIYLFIRYKLDKASKLVIDMDISENQTLIIAKEGIREILSFKNQEIFLIKFVNYIKERIKPLCLINLSPNIPAWILEIVGFSTILFVLIYLSYLGSDISEIIATLSLLLLTAWRILPMINRAMGSTVSIRSQRVHSLLCLDLLESLLKENIILPDKNYDCTFSNNITLENIYFQYPTGKLDAISNISLEIKKGDTIGLIGPSGSGKSTLALVLSGLVPVKKGRFTIDGLDMTPERLVAYAGKVGFVPQAPFLMEGTVAENVAFSSWGRQYDREAVLEACKLAAMDFVFEHPDGVDMSIMAGGQGLSGGQAQRVAIARALFSKPQVVIFDEATSALDQWNENAIKQTIEKMAGDVTVIIIAHRLATVEGCDRIFWLDDGRIKKCGPPSEILPEYNNFIR